LLIIGAGVLGLEFADYFSTFGSRVYLVDILEELLPGMDAEGVKIVRNRLLKNGCEFILSDSIKKIKEKNILLSSGKEIEAETILIAAGRKFDSSWIKDPQLKTRKNGSIQVSENLETTIAGIYAIGDANGHSLYAHAAVYQGLRVVEQILEKSKKNIIPSLVPQVIYTRPQLAQIGKTDGQKQLIKKLTLAKLGRSQTENNTEGFIKLYINEETSIIEGVILVAGQADALIGEAVVLVNKKIKINELAEMIHPHPAYSELFWEAARG